MFCPRLGGGSSEFGIRNYRRGEGLGLLKCVTRGWAEEVWNSEFGIFGPGQQSDEFGVAPRLRPMAEDCAERRNGASGAIEAQCAMVRAGRPFLGVLGIEYFEWSTPRFHGAPWVFPKSSAKPAGCRPFSAPGSRQLHREVIRQLFARGCGWQIECLW